MEKPTVEQAILQALSIRPNTRLVILLGSLASGNARQDSYLDLAVDRDIV